MGQWNSYEDFQTQIRANRELQDYLQLSAISGSQISRKIDQVPTELVQWLFHQMVAKINHLSAGYQGLSARMGRLSIIDSSSFTVPQQSWAYFSSTKHGIKMHLRLVVASPDTVYPDKMIPSTCNVDDRVPAVELVEDSDTTYIMDRGYDDYKRMDEWVENERLFVMRLRDRATITILEENPASVSSRIKRDATVRLGKAKNKIMANPLRMVEYVDEQGRLYRVVTNRWDLSADEVAQIYKSRWLIELFFKWFKQHLRMVKVYSRKPQALWNQLFIALTVYLMVLYTKLENESKKSCWKLLNQLRAYVYKSWVEFEKELNRLPTRTSKGRQKSSSPKEVVCYTTVGIIKAPK